MGVIVTEEYLCDYCTKRIPNADVLVGRLSLRKQGARGLGREVGLTLHPACLEKFTARATGVVRSRRSAIPILPRRWRSQRYRPSSRRHLPVGGGSAFRSPGQGAMSAVCSPPTSFHTGPT